MIHISVFLLVVEISNKYNILHSIYEINVFHSIPSLVLFWLVLYEIFMMFQCPVPALTSDQSAFRDTNNSLGTIEIIKIRSSSLLYKYTQITRIIRYFTDPPTRWRYARWIYITIVIILFFYLIRELIREIFCAMSYFLAGYQDHVLFSIDIII